MNRHIAVIGAGQWGKNLVRVFDSLGALRAVCDLDPGRTQGLHVSDEVQHHSDMNQVLADPQVSGVVIATPAATHHELARAALTAGRDVFVEKPLALAPEQGKELVELAEAGGRILMVGHILRYHPAVLKLQELVEAGTLGRVEYVYSNRLNLGRLRTEENILWSFAPHDVSVILSLFGERPVTVSAHGEAFLQRNISDVTLTSLEFANGARAHTFVSWLHPFKEQRLVVVGSEQMVVFEDSRPDEKLVAYPHRVEWHSGRIPVAVKGERRTIATDPAEPLRVECEHFLECLETRIPPRTDGWEGLRVLEVLHAAEQSLNAHGRVVTLAPAGNGHRRAALSPARAMASVAVGSAAASVEPGVMAAPRPAAAGFSLPGSQPAPAEGDAPFIHPSAVVDPGAEIGAGTKVWHYSHVSSGARIGRNNVFGQNVFVAPDVVTGDNCKVQNNVSLYKGVRLEDDVFCGPSCVFTNVIDPRAFIEKKSEFRPTLVRQGASIGANATIICGNTLGRYCLIGSGAVVTRDVPDHALMTGVPARQRGWVCRCGARLVLRGETAVCRCGDRYQHVDGAIRPVKGD